MKRYSLVIALPALITFACSSDDEGPSGGSGGAGGSGASAGTVGSGATAGSAGDAGNAGKASGGSGGGGSGGTGGSAGSGTEAGHTSAACGDLPILGDFGTATPAECASCVEASCCDQAVACDADPVCKAWRACADACAPLDGACRRACTEQHGSPGQLSSAFNTCRNGSCSACLDLSCIDEPFPEPTTATYSAKWFLYNFATRAGIPDLTVKVCAHADVECANPLDEGTTDAGGNVTVDMPSGPKGTSAYLEITGSGIVPQLNFIHGHGGELLFGNLGLMVLDTATGAALSELAGAEPVPDGGTMTTGTLGLLSYTCGNSPMPGVTFESSNAGATAVTSYLRGGVPDRTVTETDTSGQGTIVNHEPGATTLTMKDAASGDTLGSVDVFVRAGFFTTTSIPVGP